MFATRNATIIAVGIVIAGLLLGSTNSRAQSIPEECGIESPYEAGYGILSTVARNCEALQNVQRGIARFIEGECKLKMARLRASDPNDYGRANELIAAASNDFADAAVFFRQAAENMNPDVPMPPGAEIDGAERILEVYGYDRPQTVQETVLILADVSEWASYTLPDIRFEEGGGINSFAVDNMYSLSGAFLRPGGVLHAIFPLIRQPGA